MTITAVTALVAVVLTSDDADAWTIKSNPGEYSGYKAGVAEYHFDSYASPTTVYSRWETSSPEAYFYYYRGGWPPRMIRVERRCWLTVPIDDFVENTHIDSATIRLRYVSGHPPPSGLRAYLLNFDPRPIEAQELFGRLGTGYYLGSDNRHSSGYYEIGITGTALDYLKGEVAKGSQYVYFGFRQIYTPPFGTHYTRFSATSSHLRTYIDASGPVTPTIDPLSAFTGGSTVTVTWKDTYDLPLGGNVSGITYQVGIFPSSHPADPPSYLTGWGYGGLNCPFYRLQDDTRYYFRVRARDASGFEGSWSSAVHTTVDTSPPTVPVLDQEPLYTSGASNTLEWSPSTDAGIGVSYYQVQRATTPTFVGATTSTTSGTSMMFFGLSDAFTYYYRVRSVDAFDWHSEWSSPQYSTQDASAPTVPVPMAEPPYTAGTTNTFAWYPSVDDGVGVYYYSVQVATDPSFSPASRVVDTSTFETHYEATGLADATGYHMRARAVDHFGYTSAWSAPESSVQDDSGPGGCGLHPLAPYSPVAPVHLEWNGSVDAGAGVGWYRVLWSNEGDFSANVSSQDYVLGHGFLVPPLEENHTWFVRVVPFDMLGNEGAAETVNTTVDGTPPTAPVIDPEPEYTPGAENAISWQPSADNISGVDHYLVRAFARSGTGLVFTDVTNLTSMTVPGLADGATYWYQVVAVDAAGNANASALVWSTQDASPPTPPAVGPLPGFTKGTEVAIEWRPSVDAGSGGVEYMVEWATDPDFTLGLEGTEWMSANSYDMVDLSDDTTYFVRVRARDALGHESLPGNVVSTRTDASPPTVPRAEPLDEFVPGPLVHLEWQPSQDASGMPVEYRVLAYDTDDAGADPVFESRPLRDTALAVPGLSPDTLLYLHVVAIDHLGWISGPSSAVTTTIDATGPGAATADPLPAFTRGDSVTVNWTTAVDSGTGGVMHRLVVYGTDALLTPVHVSEWAPGTEDTVDGLDDGATYWFEVECIDAFGNEGGPSEAVSTTMDASAPELALHFPGFFGGRAGGATGTVSDAVSGVASVEHSVDGESWTAAELEAGEWEVPLAGLPELTSAVLVRATDAVGNVLGDPLMVPVDIVRPRVLLTSPVNGDEVTGPTPVVGLIEDQYGMSYVVEVQGYDADTWDVVQPPQSTHGITGTLATWLPAGLAGGDYTLRVTATDIFDQEGTAVVTVTLRGARLSIGTSDISFSDSHPLPGDMVTVFVTVHNEGDCPAEGVEVTVYQRGKPVGSQVVNVPAHGTAVVSVRVKAEDGQQFTARATSTFYDTGEMETAQPLQTIEEEAALENAGGILGLVALILAIVCLLLIIMGRMGGKEEPVVGPEEDIIVEEGAPAGDEALDDLLEDM